MVRHEVEDDFQPHAMGGCDKSIEVGQGPKQRIDRAVIRDVVAEIYHRRSEDRRNPNGIYSQLSKIREAAQYPLQVADAVFIAVLKGPRVDLIDDSGLPPRGTHESR